MNYSELLSFALFYHALRQGMSPFFARVTYQWTIFSDLIDCIFDLNKIFEWNVCPKFWRQCICIFSYWKFKLLIFLCIFSRNRCMFGELGQWHDRRSLSMLCATYSLSNAQPILHQLDRHSPGNHQPARSLPRGLCEIGQLDWTHQNRNQSLFCNAISTLCWHQRNQCNVLLVVGYRLEIVFQIGMPPIEYHRIAMLQNMDWCSSIVQCESAWNAVENVEIFFQKTKPLFFLLAARIRTRSVQIFGSFAIRWYLHNGPGTFSHQWCGEFGQIGGASLQTRCTIQSDHQLVWPQHPSWLFVLIKHQMIVGFQQPWFQQESIFLCWADHIMIKTTH